MVSSTQTIDLTTGDGERLTADLSEPTGAVHGSVVVCHPHPLYGGNRHNAVVDAVFRALPDAGFRALRFDFRAARGDGIDPEVSAITDVAAALDELAGREGGGPLYLIGYSFGAVAALRTADARITATVAIAPPLPVMPIDPPPAVPVFVLAARHDQFASPDEIASIVAAWPDAEVVAIESADHFLAGHTAHVAARTIDWLTARSSGSG